MPGLESLWALLPGIFYTLAVNVLTGAVPDAAHKPPDAAVSPCALAFASGEPLRQVEKARVVMRLESRCEQPVGSLRWLANGDEVQAARVSTSGQDTLFLILIGRLESERLTVAVTRGNPGEADISRVTTGTKAMPGLLATLEIPGQGAIDFIPKNREARLDVLVEAGHLTLLPVAGAYKVRRDTSGTFVQAEPDADGTVSLRFAYRMKSLPGALAGVDLAVVTESIARPIRVATLPLHGERRSTPGKARSNPRSPSRPPQ